MGSTEETKKAEVEGSEVQSSEMSRLSKFEYVMGNITVEPMLALYVMVSVMSSLTTQNLSLEKACRVNLNYSDVVCTALTNRETNNYTVEEAAVQQLVAGMISWKTVVQSALPSFLMLFLGSWSDRMGVRKPCMLLPILGEILTSIGLIVCTYFFYELPMEVAGVVESLFPALTGGWFTMFMAVFSYIGDVTTVEMRTLRIGFANLFVSLGVPIGMALSGVLYRKIGFYGVFSLSASLYIVSFLYGLFRIKEVPRKIPIINEKAKIAPTRSCDSLREFFDVKHVADTLRVTFKKGARNRRLRVAMLMIACMVIIGPLHGELTVLYLFTRYKFKWDEVDFSMFSTYSCVTNLFGTMVSVCLFSHVMKIDDAIIGAMSCMSKILSGFVYAYAATDFIFYLAPLVEILNGTSFIAMRSIASKLVPADELGKVNSVFGVCEALMPLIYGPMYTGIYARTMETLPGAFFLIGGALTAPAVLIFLWMYTEHRKRGDMNPGDPKTNKLNGTIEPSVEVEKSLVLNPITPFNPKLVPAPEIPLYGLFRSLPEDTPNGNSVGFDNKAFQKD